MHEGRSGRGRRGHGTRHPDVRDPGVARGASAGGHDGARRRGGDRGHARRHARPDRPVHVEPGRGARGAPGPRGEPGAGRGRDAPPDVARGGRPGPRRGRDADGRRAAGARRRTSRPCSAPRTSSAGPPADRGGPAEDQPDAVDLAGPSLRPAARAAPATAGPAAGTRRPASSRSIRRAVAVTSIGSSSPRSVVAELAVQARPEPPQHLQLLGRRTARRASPQSTVRSLGTGENVTPWSTPYTWPPGHREQVAGLAVGVVDRGVEDGDPPQARVRVDAPARRGRPSASARIQSWTMPSPNGPSRRTVGGTMSQPRRPRDGERRHLAPGEGPVREVAPAAARPMTGL